MTTLLAASAVLLALISGPLALVAVVRRRANGASWALTAVVVAIASLALAAQVGPALASSFGSAFSPGASITFRALSHTYEETFPAYQRLALVLVGLGAAALLVAALAVGLVVRLGTDRSWRRTSLVLLAAGAVLVVLAQWNARVADRARTLALSDALAVISSDAARRCPMLRSVLDDVSIDEVERQEKHVREIARACVAEEIAHLDDKGVRRTAQGMAALARSRGIVAPETPAAQLAQSPLLVDPAQRAEVERRLANEGK